MTRTFAEVLSQYEEYSPHKFTPGRKASYCIEDVLGKGHELMLVHDKQARETIAGDSIDESNNLHKPEIDDIVIDL